MSVAEEGAAAMQFLTAVRIGNSLLRLGCSIACQAMAFQRLAYTQMLQLMVGMSARFMCYASATLTLTRCSTHKAIGSWCTI
mmetsp:Transcript_44087/g.133573  ORF Transcript_44087/g.133573 Transcript_44087/m.133573 type:complete len:82 (-) Transcript_44087:1010-1255(-)